MESDQVKVREDQLVLLTQSYPFGTGEPFLETEIHYLSEAFSHITIVTQNTQSENCRPLPENCTVLREGFEASSAGKVLALTGYFDQRARNELSVALEEYNCSRKQIFKTLLVSQYRAKRIAAFLSTLLAKMNPESTVCYSYWSDDAAIGLAILKEKGLQAKCISRVHGWDLYFEASAVNYLPFRRFLGQHLDRIFPISSKGKEYCRKRWGISAEVLSISRLGVGKQCDGAQPASGPLVVSCSNVIPLKRVHLIVEAMALLADTDIQWVHFGAGSELEAMKQRASELLPEERYTFMGQVTNVALMDWYKQHVPAVFINVSSTEGIPVSIMEAMSFGVPAIATNVGGTAELVNATNGILLSENPAVEDIAEALHNVLFAEPDIQEKRRNQAYATWRDQYYADENYADFAAGLKAMLTR